MASLFGETKLGTSMPSTPRVHTEVQLHTASSFEAFPITGPSSGRNGSSFGGRSRGCNSPPPITPAWDTPVEYRRYVATEATGLVVERESDDAAGRLGTPWQPLRAPTPPYVPDPGFGIVQKHASVRGTRAHQLDTCHFTTFAACPATGAPATTYAAIFDGHGCDTVAKYAKLHLHEFVRAAPTYATDLPAAMVHALFELDCALYGVRASANGGATAIVACVRGRTLYVANLGDCRAVLGLRSGAVVPLSRDHRASDPQEDRRMRACGGSPDGLGGLGVCRALGDFDKKVVACLDDVAPAPAAPAVAAAGWWVPQAIDACDYDAPADADTLVRPPRGLQSCTPHAMRPRPHDTGFDDDVTAFSLDAGALPMSRWATYPCDAAATAQFSRDPTPLHFSFSQPLPSCSSLLRPQAADVSLAEFRRSRWVLGNVAEATRIDIPDDAHFVLLASDGVWDSGLSNADAVAIVQRCIGDAMAAPEVEASTPRSTQFQHAMNDVAARTTGDNSTVIGLHFGRW